MVMKCPGERRADVLVSLVDWDWRELIDTLLVSPSAERVFYHALGRVDDMDKFQEEYKEHVPECDICTAAYSRYILNKSE